MRKTLRLGLLAVAAATSLAFVTSALGAYAPKLLITQSDETTAITYSPRRLHCLPSSTSGAPAVPLVMASCAVQGPPSKPNSTPRSGVLKLMPVGSRVKALSSCRRMPKGRYIWPAFT